MGARAGRYAPGMKQRAAVVFLAGLVSAAGAQTAYTLDGAGAWVAEPTGEVDADAALMAQVRGLLAEERAGEALPLIDEWLDVNKRGESPYLPEAYLLRGDAYVMVGREYKALYDYEVLIKSFSASEHYTTAVRREVDIGRRYVNGLRRKFLGVRVDNAENLGEELLIRAQERVPGSDIAEDAAIELAEFYYRERDLGLAADMFDVFATNYPNSRYTQRAMLGRILVDVARFKGPKYDASGLIEARLLIEDYLEQYPADAARAGVTEGLRTRIDESAADHKLETARFYLRRGDRTSAIFTLRRLVRDHPITAASQRALAYLQEQGEVVEEGDREALRPREAGPAGEGPRTLPQSEPVPGLSPEEPGPAETFPNAVTPGNIGPADAAPVGGRPAATSPRP